MSVSLQLLIVSRIQSLSGQHWKLIHRSRRAHGLASSGPDPLGFRT